MYFNNKSIVIFALILSLIAATYYFQKKSINQNEIPKSAKLVFLQREY